MVLKIYIAGHFEARETFRPIRDRLWAMGHGVVSTWLDEVKKPEGMLKSEFYRKLAQKDLCEINAADLLVLCTESISERGGAATEFGFALGRHQGCLVYIVGPRRSVFHELADRQFDTWELFLDHMHRAHPAVPVDPEEPVKVKVRGKYSPDEQCGHVCDPKNHAGVCPDGRCTWNTHLNNRHCCGHPVA